MLHIIAHNGLDHATELEESMHASQSPVLMIVLVSLAALLFVGSTIYFLQKRAGSKVSNREEEK